MDIVYFIEEPLLKFVFYVFAIGISLRFGFFLVSIFINSFKQKKNGLYLISVFGRFFIPLHRLILKKPVYSLLRYAFHACLVIVPVWFSGHIMLWEESSLEWYWTPIPDEVADAMTLILIGMALLLFFRRIIIPKIRKRSSAFDYIFILMASLPFISGYFLTHGTLESISFFEENIWTIHVLSAEIFLLSAVFLFCRTRLNTDKCVACASCAISCPTGTLEAQDTGSERVFNYSAYQCICCGSCVKTCPEDAAELRHEINPLKYFLFFNKQRIRIEKLFLCQQCGSPFAPEPQIEKVSMQVANDNVRLCPVCRKTNLGEKLLRFSPWHQKLTKKADPCN